MSKKGNTGFRNNDLFCFNCGGKYIINYPQPISMVTAMMDQFVKDHENCLPTWKEPEVNQKQSVKQKAFDWLQNGETGLSSKTMWFCFMGEEIKRPSHPYDPGDFKRCYKLLQAVPEWKLQLHNLKPLSKEWSNLVDNWDQLTDMYEQNKKEDWKNHKIIGMYEFMQTLIS